MKIAVRILPAFALTGALVGLILVFVPIDRVRQAFRAFDPVWLAPLVGCYALTFPFRAARFRAFGIPLSFPSMLGVVSVYVFAVRVAPLRSGEVALPVIVKRLSGTPLTHGFAAIALSHLSDLAALALATLAALVAAPDVRAAIGPVWTTLVGAGLAAVIAGYFLVPALAGRSASWLARRLRAARPALADRLDGSARTLEEVRAVARRAAGPAALWTALQWVAAVGSFWAAAESVGIDLGLARIVLGSGAAVLAGVVPISGVGSFGAFEGAWAAGFVLVGAPSGAAVASALVMSASTFAFTGLAAGACMLVRLAGRKTRAP
ncbi:MAG: lysylphosphatidylglycerol synthase transmembrane domain-containing protein [Myxococcota bacterium]|nr:lysylphosphatidylglycerol synthase transmembrane domain-containing protein [Myxococcota bacterium]